jgi:hypothetical protein
MFCLTNCLTTCRHSQRLSPTVGESIARGSGVSARAHERLIGLTRKRSPVQTQYRPPHREASRTCQIGRRGLSHLRLKRRPDQRGTDVIRTAARPGRPCGVRRPRVERGVGPGVEHLVSAHQVGIDDWVRFEEDFRRDRAVSATSAGGLLWSPGRRRHRSGSVIRSRDRTAADGRRDRLVRPRPLRPDRW